MILEYILLLTVASLILFKGISAGSNAFKNSGPLLGARIERNLVTGNGFKRNGQVDSWIQP